MAGVADDTLMDGGQPHDLDDKPIAVDSSFQDKMGLRMKQLPEATA